MNFKNVAITVSLFVLGAGGPGCVAGEGSSQDDTATQSSSLTEASPQMAPGVADRAESLEHPAGAPDGAALLPTSGPVVTARVDWRVNWPVAGLYKDDCHGGIVEDMSSGTGVEYLWQQSACSGETRFYVIDLPTGHRGWVRGVALRLP